MERKRRYWCQCAHEKDDHTKRALTLFAECNGSTLVRHNADGPHVEAQCSCEVFVFWYSDLEPEA